MTKVTLPARMSGSRRLGLESARTGDIRCDYGHRGGETVLVRALRVCLRTARSCLLPWVTRQVYVHVRAARRLAGSRIVSWGRRGGIGGRASMGVVVMLCSTT